MSRKVHVSKFEPTTSGMQHWNFNHSSTEAVRNVSRKRFNLIQKEVAFPLCICIWGMPVRDLRAYGRARTNAVVNSPCFKLDLLQLFFI
jgi:hypothetical protein